MANEYQDTLDVINQMAMVKMAMNRHKGKIESCDTDKILQMSFDEMRELEAALGEDDLMHIIEEAADVMNFLVAIVHKQIELYRTRKND